MEHRKPTDEKPLFINLFVDNHLMTEANIASSLQLNEKWSTVTMGHYSSMPMGHDGNGDGFKDEPTSLKFNLTNRWLYYDESGMQIRFGIRALTDDRTGGMTSFRKEMRSENRADALNTMGQAVAAGYDGNTIKRTITNLNPDL